MRWSIPRIMRAQSIHDKQTDHDLQAAGLKRSATTNGLGWEGDCGRRPSALGTGRRHLCNRPRETVDAPSGWALEVKKAKQQFHLTGCAPAVREGRVKHGDTLSVELFVNGIPVPKS
jgi:hypothetical protein